jgi:hypothetical protein
LAFRPAMSLSITERNTLPEPVCLMSSPRTGAALRVIEPLWISGSLFLA